MDPWDEKAHMSRQSLHRHFPTAVWLGRQIAAELRSLVADFKKSFPRETALSPLEWCLIPLTCVGSAALGLILGCGLACGWPHSWRELESGICSAVCMGMPVGLIAAVPVAIVTRASSRQVVKALLVTNALLATGTAIAMWCFISASLAS
jgi:hypothetical protein